MILLVCVLYLVIANYFLEVAFSIPYKEYENDPWSENMVLLISPENNPSMKFPALIKNVKKGWDLVTIHCSVNFNILGPNVSGSLYLKTSWTAKLLMNLTTEVREYSALGKFNCFRLLNHILKPPKDFFNKSESSQVGSYMSKLAVNKPQAIAIARASEQENGFVLIQGPPGSGKTKTILGLVGALQSQPGHISVSSGTRVSATGSRTGFKKRLLICAPSNAAIDEIGRRLMKGILNTSGQVYTPKLVRIGKPSSVHLDVLSISLVCPMIEYSFFIIG